VTLRPALTISPEQSEAPSFITKGEYQMKLMTEAEAEEAMAVARAELRAALAAADATGDKQAEQAAADEYKRKIDEVLGPRLALGWDKLQ
jgi:hypothetical protein